MDNIYRCYLKILAICLVSCFGFFSSAVGAADRESKINKVISLKDGLQVAPLRGHYRHRHRYRNRYYGNSYYGIRFYGNRYYGNRYRRNVSRTYWTRWRGYWRGHRYCKKRCLISRYSGRAMRCQKRCR